MNIKEMYVAEDKSHVRMFVFSRNVSEFFVFYNSLTFYKKILSGINIGICYHIPILSFSKNDSVKGKSFDSGGE